MQKLKQAAFFHLIGEKITNGKNLVSVVMKLLGLSQNQTYRRINGQTALSFEDTAILANHFQISLDDLLLDNNDVIGFQFSPIGQPSFSYEMYLKQLDQELKQVQQLSGGKLLYATNEFPIFYTFLSPQLVQFKLYMWERTFWEKTAHSNKLFNLELLEEETLQLAEDVRSRYHSLDTEEFWSIRLTDNTLHQINYAMESGLFENQQDILILCEQLKKMLTQVELMAKNGRKILSQQQKGYKFPEFKLYLNDLPTNILLLASSIERSFLYVAFDNPNFIKTDNQKLCHYTHLWFDKLRKKSLLLSSSAERTRKRFFMDLKKKVTQLEDRVEKLST